ncbi:MAG: acyl-CoA thioesterase [Bacteroidales bacterium]|nr:acyl-CoA thioesterase [Bacteroidales bacterium]
MHKTPIQIRFNDVDQMGHVNNAVIMEYLDLGKDAFFSGRGLSPTKSDFTVMVVHYDVDFRKQIHYHDQIEVTTEVEKIGNKSITVLQRVVNTETGDICVECRTVMAGYRRSTSSSEVIPPEVRAWLTR